MSYVNSAVGTLVTALLLGAVTGAGEVFTSALAKLSPEDKQVLYAAGESDALNNTAFFVLLLTSARRGPGVLRSPLARRACTRK